MTEFMVNDIVRVEMPRGYSNRGVLGISLMFSTMPEAKFEGAIGTITSINPVGPQSVPQYLVDFRTHDNSRVGIPWQAQWFREEWLALRERPAARTTPAAKIDAAAATWPTRGDAATAVMDAPPDAPSSSQEPGIAHPGAKLFTEGVRDFAPPASEEPKATMPAGVVPADDRSAAQLGTYEPTAPSGELIVERGDGFVRVTNMSVCPDGFPIKGNANSMIYHAPTDKTYAKTIPEICFASEDVAIANGFRAPKNRG